MTRDPTMLSLLDPFALSLAIGVAKGALTGLVLASLVRPPNQLGPGRDLEGGSVPDESAIGGPASADT
jgi:hypothetical protein